MIKAALAIAALATTAVTFGQSMPQVDPEVWIDAKPATSVTVSATDKDGIYLVQARVKDLRNGSFLQAPALTTKSGYPTTFEIGSQRGVTVKFVVTVDASGRTADYVSEIRKNGQLETSQSANIAVTQRTT